MKLAISILMVAIVVIALAEKFSYKGYKLIRLFPTDEQLHYLHKLEDQDNNLDIWGEVLVGDLKSVDLMLTPSSFSKYARIFAAKKIPFEMVHENVQDIIDQESESMVRNRQKNNRNDILYTFARYSEIMNYIEEMVEKNSDIASSEVIGLTEERRQLKLIKLRSGNPQKSIWIDCGIHAREWVSPSTCVYIIYALIDEYRDFNPEIMNLFSKYEFYILPSLNPDGYEYSHTTTRLWRKNRASTTGTCSGVDLNRNFPFKWLSGGASTLTCADTYAGPSAASEPETKAVVNYITAKAGQWDSFLSIHTYGCYWLTPFGHSLTEPVPDEPLLLAAAKVGVDAIKDYNGTQFTYGRSSELLYIHSGLSPDWAYADMGIRYSHVIELRPCPNTTDYQFGFTLPEDRMPIVAPETYNGIKSYLTHISKL